MQALADDCRQRERQRDIITKRKVEEYGRLQADLKVRTWFAALLIALESPGRG
jgi:hypothetical protein